MSPSFAGRPMLASRLPPLITTTLRIMKKSAREAVFGCRLRRDRRLTCGSARFPNLATLLWRLYQALPHLFARLRALLPLILMRLQPLQLALFQTSGPSALCSLFQSLL